MGMHQSMRKAESMSNAKHILIAVDDSEASYRAITYVGSIMSGCEGFRVCLLHALPPLPREFLEFGGSEDPQQEEQEETRLHTEQTPWIEPAPQPPEPVFTRAKQILHEARVPEDAVETQMVDTVKTLRISSITFSKRHTHVIVVRWWLVVSRIMGSRPF